MLISNYILAKSDIQALSYQNVSFNERSSSNHSCSKMIRCMSGRKQPRAYDIKKAISAFEFYSFELNGLKIRKDEWNDGGLCPFHDDKKAGSFYVNLTSGAYNCFSCNAKGGDVIAFTMNLYGLSFSEAINKLSQDWGLA